MFSVTAKYSNGFTLVEVLISLAILAMLLTAAAIAFDASVMSHTENESLFKASNYARQALLRITTELRTASAVAVTEPAGQCSLVTANGSNITYRYDSDDSTLYLVTNDNLTDDDYILCENVTAMTFTKATDPLDPGVVKNVQITITVSYRNASQTVSTAAVVRANI